MPSLVSLRPNGGTSPAAASPPPLLSPPPAPVRPASTTAHMGTAAMPALGAPTIAALKRVEYLCPYLCGGKFSCLPHNVCGNLNGHLKQCSRIPDHPDAIPWARDALRAFPGMAWCCDCHSLRDPNRGSHLCQKNTAQRRRPASQMEHGVEEVPAVQLVPPPGAPTVVFPPPAQALSVGATAAAAGAAPAISTPYLASLPVQRWRPNKQHARRRVQLGALGLPTVTIFFAAVSVIEKEARYTDELAQRRAMLVSAPGAYNVAEISLIDAQLHTSEDNALRAWSDLSSLGDKRFARHVEPVGAGGGGGAPAPPPPPSPCPCNGLDCRRAAVRALPSPDCSCPGSTCRFSSPSSSVISGVGWTAEDDLRSGPRSSQRAQGARLPRESFPQRRCQVSPDPRAHW